MKTMKTLAILIFAALITMSCNQTPPEITLSSVWSRPVELAAANCAHATNGETKAKSACCAADAKSSEKPACCQDNANGVVYLQIKNSGGKPDRLLNAKSDVADVVEIHESKMENERMSMQKVAGGIEIPAGQTVELKPGGYHIMLIGLKHGLKIDEEFSVDLEFEQSPAMTVTSTVKLF